jgi:hypothetical protein
MFKGDARQIVDAIVQLDVDEEAASKDRGGGHEILRSMWRKVRAHSATLARLSVLLEEM